MNEIRRLPRAAIAVLFLLFGTGSYTWVQWRLERIFARADPSGLTSPLIPFPD